MSAISQAEIPAFRDAAGLSGSMVLLVSGVGLGTGVTVTGDSGVRDAVGVAPAVVVGGSRGIGVGVGAAVGTSVGMGVGVAVAEGAGEGAGVGAAVGVGEGVGDGSGIGVSVGVGSGVDAGVGSGVGVDVGSGVGVAIGVGVGVGVGSGPTRRLLSPPICSSSVLFWSLTIPEKLYVASTADV